MLSKKISIGNKTATGYEIALPTAKIILAKADKGFLMCGYLNIQLAENLGDCAAIVRGVKTLDELLAGRVVEITSAARNAGIKIGMTGIKALEKMF